MKTPTLFKTLSLGSIGLAIFNTVKGNNYRKLLDELKKEKQKVKICKVNMMN